jgi:hypothetical protein
MDYLWNTINPFQLGSASKAFLYLIGGGILIFSIGHLLFGTAKMIEAVKKELPEEENTSEDENPPPLDFAPYANMEIQVPIISFETQ